MKILVLIITLTNYYLNSSDISKVFDEGIVKELNAYDKNKVKTLLIYFTYLFIQEKKIYQTDWLDLRKTVDCFISELENEDSFENAEKFDKEKIDIKPVMHELQKRIYSLEEEIKKDERSQLFFEMIIKRIEVLVDINILDRNSEVRRIYFHARFVNIFYLGLFNYYKERFKENPNLLFSDDPIFNTLEKNN